MRNTKNLLILGALAGAFLHASPAAADPYDQLTENLSHIAQQAGYSRLAVLPFRPATGGNGASGLVVSERLVSRMASRPGLQIVERTLLQSVLREQELGYQGVIDAAQAQQVGAVLGVQAIVTGTYLRLDKGVLEVHTRLIDARTARILGAATAKVKEEWRREDDFFGSGSVMNVPPPSLDSFSGGMGFSREPVLEPVRDSLAPIVSCDGWEDRVDRLQSATLELKARYWAARLLQPGFSARDLTRNPGSEIRSNYKRQELYRRMKELYNAGNAGGLSVMETERMNGADRQAARLRQNCY